MQDRNELWKEYYKKILSNPHRVQTEKAVNLNSSNNFHAIDCGCGTGADIGYLESKGYSVHGFDLHEQSVKICNDRFSGTENVKVSHSSFIDFSYKKSGVVLANSSLFFCEPSEFSLAWSKISDSIVPGGVFCGDFIGLEDSWVKDPEIIVCPLSENDVRELFNGYEIKQFLVRKEDGITALGVSKHWHTYQVIAVKCI